MSERCALCPNRYKCVPFSGPVNSPLRFVGEAPGWDEEKKGECFVGKTGREVNEGYLPLAGLRRTNIRIGNAIGCLPDTPQHKLDLSKAPHRDLLTACAGHRLYPELQAYPPSLIIPMGAFACYAIDPDIDLEFQHGIPIETKRGWVFPMYHPAGGIHEPKKMLQIRTDWYRLKQYLAGRLELGVDDYADREDYSIITGSDVHSYLTGYEERTIACDTETTRKGEPYCLSFSARPGTGRIIRADDKDGLDAFQSCLDRWEGKILWHNWLFDWKVVRTMGLRFPLHLIVDTMVRAFQLGNLPQGLKALAYRELGMKMLDFDDLVRPASSHRVLDYYGNAAREDWPKPEPIQERQSDGSFKTKQPHSMKTKFKTFFTYWKKNPDKDVFEAWANWKDSHALIQDKMGPWPGKCITHAAEDNWDQVVWYACRDADALLRLYPVLLWMESRVRKRPQEQWRERDVA